MQQVMLPEPPFFGGGGGWLHMLILRIDASYTSATLFSRCAIHFRGDNNYFMASCDT